MTVEPSAPNPDDKDWAWVLHEPCPECGFDAAAIGGADVPGIVGAMVERFREALTRPGATTRPAPQIWSPLEYACHVRDVCRVCTGRLDRMLTEDDPVFANWDQDATALEERYWTQDPATVAGELAAAGARIADAFAAVTGEQWARPSRRSNGSVFTVDTFSRYVLHDLVHHVHDIGA